MMVSTFAFLLMTHLSLKLQDTFRNKYGQKTFCEHQA